MTDEKFLQWAVTLVIGLWVGAERFIRAGMSKKIEKTDERFEVVKQELSVGRANLDAHRLYAAETFARKDDVKDLSREIKEMRGEINSKLDDISKTVSQKVDKNGI